MIWKRKSNISPLENGPVHPHIRKVKYPLHDCVGVSISWNNDTEKVTCEYLWTFWLRGWELPKFPNSSKWTREVWELLKFHAKVKDMLCFHGCNPCMSSAEKFKYVHVFFPFPLYNFRSKTAISFGKQRWNCSIHHHQINCFT